MNGNKIFKGSKWVVMNDSNELKKAFIELSERANACAWDMSIIAKCIMNKDGLSLRDTAKFLEYSAGTLSDMLKAFDACDKREIVPTKFEYRKIADWVRAYNNGTLKKSYSFSKMLEGSRDDLNANITSKKDNGKNSETITFTVDGVTYENVPKSVLAKYIKKEEA